MGTDNSFRIPEDSTAIPETITYFHINYVSSVFDVQKRIRGRIEITK
jgi:hypothetical protein